MKPLVLSARSPTADIGGLGTGRRYLRVRSAISSPADDRDAALIADDRDWELAEAHRYEFAIGRDPRPVGAMLKYVRLPTGFAELEDGDVLGIYPQSGRVRVLYRRSSRHNFFLVTERCNNYCLMCSQPPKKVDDDWLIDEIAEALPLVDLETPALTFTGGEPLTEWRRFIGLLELTRDLLPNTAVHVLTNGRAFLLPKSRQAGLRFDIQSFRRAYRSTRPLTTSTITWSKRRGRSTRRSSACFISKIAVSESKFVSCSTPSLRRACVKPARGSPGIYRSWIMSL